MNKSDYKEPLRPKYHFTAYDSWINDPNGLVYFNGVYHMYYQSNPHVNVWGNMTWGHAVSEDLIHWKEEGWSLFPDKIGTMFSGGGYVDINNRSGFFDSNKGGIIVAYSTSTQHIGIAYSNDGYTFTKLSETKPIIQNPGVNDFRDPFIFYHGKTKKWIILLAGGQVRFYSSNDLYNWVKAKFPGHLAASCKSVPLLEIYWLKAVETRSDFEYVAAVLESAHSERGCETIYSQAPGLFIGRLQVEFEAFLTSCSSLRLGFKASDELKPSVMVVLLTDNLEPSEIPGDLQKILVTDLVLLRRPDVAVAIDKNGIVSFIEQSLNTACRTWPAATVDQNLLFHETNDTLLQQNRPYHIINLLPAIFPSRQEKGILSLN